MKKIIHLMTIVQKILYFGSKNQKTTLFLAIYLRNISSQLVFIAR